MDKDPRTLRDDPVLSLDYHRIIELIKQKKLLEETADLYDPENSTLVDWKDPDIAIQQSKLLKKKQLERMMRREVLGQSVGGGRTNEDFEKEQSDVVRKAVDTKKDSLKQKKQMIS